MTWLYVLLLCGVALAQSPEENAGSNDRNLFGGDMILTAEQRRAIELGDEARGASVNKQWPGAVLPFTIDSTLSKEKAARMAINQGMNDWKKKTCIRFRKKKKNDKDYVNFRLGSGCSSFVGKRGGKQDINLARGCWTKGIVSHEIGHAVGFYHEQSRPDRDKYVKILFQNIQDGKAFNFNKINSIKSLGSPYDYGSVMHYGEKFFSKNGKPTIMPLRNVEIGQRKGLSKIDAAQANTLYKGKNKRCKNKKG